MQIGTDMITTAEKFLLNLVSYTLLIIPELNISLEISMTISLKRKLRRLGQKNGDFQIKEKFNSMLNTGTGVCGLAGALKKSKMSIWDESADFWIGAGLVAEAPIGLASWLLPDGFCHAYLGRIMDCPPSISVLCALWLASYIAVAFIGHKMGLGSVKK